MKSLKSFDYKDFLLQRGERVGLIVCLALMVLLFVGGTISGLSLDGPDHTAAALNGDASEIRRRIANDQSIKQLPPNPLIDQAAPNQASKEVPPLAYRFPQDPIIPWALEIKGRQNPHILEVDSGEVSFVKAGVWMPDLQVRRDDVKVHVLVAKEPKDKPKGPMPDNRNPQQYQQLLAAYRQQGVFNQPNGPVGFRPGGAGADGNLDPTGTKKEELKAEWVRLEDLKPNAQIARTVQPVRMAVLSAAFPYRRQLEEYGQALLRGNRLSQFAEHPDLVPHFRGCNVRRRSLDAAGKPIIKPGTDAEGWEPLNLDGEYKTLLAYSLMLNDRKDREDAGIEAVKFPGLVLPRLPLVDPTKDQYIGEYPPVHLGDIDKSIRDLTSKAKGSPEARVLTPVQKLLGDGKTSIFEALPATAEAPRDKGRVPLIQKFNPYERPMAGPAGGAAAEKQELIAPDHCLVRVTDVTVKPGQTYEYQLQVIARNPNFGKKPPEIAYENLGKQADLIGAWGPAKPLRVVVPEENFVYATDFSQLSTQDVKEYNTATIKDHHAFVQVHRWMETIKLSSNGLSLPLGGWVIADLPVKRGEYLGLTKSVEVPMWFSSREVFDIPMMPQSRATRKEKGVPIDLATREVLADYEGGRTQTTLRKNGAPTIIEEAGFELLVVSADGRLRVMSNKADVANAERSARQKEWQTAVETVRKNAAAGAAGTGAANPFK